jgi:glycosyltransferase involved in cell wall biosynthesis
MTQMQHLDLDVDGMRVRSPHNSAGVPRLRVLLSLEMATLGVSGIPNETRILTDLLVRSGVHDFSGFIMESADQFTANLAPSKVTAGELDHLNASNFLVGLDRQETPFGFRKMNRLRRAVWRLNRHFLEAKRGFGLSKLPPGVYDDALWRLLFAKTLAPDRRELLNYLDFVVSRLTLSDIHRHVSSQILPQIRLSTEGYDVAVFHDSRPLRLSPGTARVIRYHDSIPLSHPDLLGDGEYTSLHYRMLKAAAKDSWFVCNSKATLNELMNFAPEAASKALVIPCAQSFSRLNVHSESPVREIIRRRASDLMVRPTSASNDSHALDLALAGSDNAFKYIIGVAALEPKKNIRGLISAYEALLARETNAPKLILIGSPSWKFEGDLKAMEPHIRRGRLFHLSDVPSLELASLMAGAELCFFPSLAEGFGYPPLEALYAGVPSVVSDIPALRETMGACSLYVNPLDPDGMASAIQQLLDPANGPQLKAKLLEARKEVLSRYEPDCIASQWNALICEASSQCKSTHKKAR